MTVVHWNLAEYEALLRLRAQQLHWDPRLRRRLDWADLVQEALLRAHERLPQFAGTTRPELVSWLLTILDNAYKDRVDREFAGKRDAAREQALNTAVSESSARLEAYLAAQDSTPSQKVEREETLLRMAAALDELTEEERQVVILRHLSGATMGEIAEQTGRPQTTVSRLLLRAMNRLREKLDPCP
jgi:RNA polymerase sigma-70 factor (ECF subfamily)